MATVGKQFQCLIIIISFSLSLSIRVEKFNKAQTFPEFQIEDNNGYGLYPQKDDNHLEPEPKQSPVKPDFAGLTPEEKNFIWNQYQIEKRQRKELNGEKPHKTASESDDPTLSDNWDDNSWDEEDEEARPEYERAFDNWSQDKKMSARNYKFGPREESSQQQWSNNKYEQLGEWANNKHEPQREQLDGERWDRNRPQGMSDTRSVQGGKYHYDLNNNKYSSEHPYTQFYNKAELDYEPQP